MSVKDFIAEDVINMNEVSEDLAVRKALAEYKPRQLVAGNTLPLFNSVIDNKGNKVPLGNYIIRTVKIPHRASTNPLYYIQMSPEEKPELTFRANLTPEDIYKSFCLNLKYDIHRLAFKGAYGKMINRYLKEKGLPVDNSIDWDSIVENIANGVLYSSYFKNDEGEKSGIIIDTLLKMFVDNPDTFRNYNPEVGDFVKYFVALFRQNLRNALSTHLKNKKRNTTMDNSDNSDFTNEEQMDYLNYQNQGEQSNIDDLENERYVEETKNQIINYLEKLPKWNEKYKPIWDMLREGKSLREMMRELGLPKTTVSDRYRKLIEFIKNCAEENDNEILYKLVEMHQNPNYVRHFTREHEESDYLKRQRDKQMDYLKRKNEEYYKKFSSLHTADSDEELHKFMVDFVRFFDSAKHTAGLGSSVFKEILTDVFGKDVVDIGGKVYNQITPLFNKDKDKKEHEAALKITKKTLNNFLSDSKLIEASFNTRQTMEDMQKTESDIYTALLEDCEDIIEEGTSIYGLKATREAENTDGEDVPQPMENELNTDKTSNKKATLKDIYGCEEFENELYNPYI